MVRHILILCYLHQKLCHFLLVSCSQPTNRVSGNSTLESDYQKAYLLSLKFEDNEKKQLEEEERQLQQAISDSRQQLQLEVLFFAALLSLTFESKSRHKSFRIIEMVNRILKMLKAPTLSTLNTSLRAAMARRK